MKIEVYKLLLLAVLLVLVQPLMAQTPPAAPRHPAPSTRSESSSFKDLGLQLKQLDIKLKNLDLKFNQEFKVNEKLILEKLDLLKNLPEFNLQSDFLLNNKTEQKEGGNTIEKVKIFTKSYPVDKNDKLLINNQFGKVVINTWKKDEVKVDIEISAFDNSEAGAQALLDDTKIDESKNANLVSFKTNIDRNTSINWSGGKNERKGITVNYTVYMPRRNSLEIVNKFGSITLPDFDGAVNIKNSYGSLTAADLHHAENQIDVKNGSVRIGKFAAGNINVQFGSLTIGSSNQLKAIVKHGSIKIGHLARGGDLENKYGSLKIDELDANIRSLIINTDKGSATIGVKPSLNFDFDVTVKLGGFQYPDENVDITSQTPEKKYGPLLIKNYKGKYGKGSNDMRMQIVSNYGSVKLTSTP